MTTILTQHQARAVADVIARLSSTVGGRITRMSLPDGDFAIRIHCHPSGKIVVRRVDGRHIAVTMRQYDSLARFAAAHQEEGA